MYTWLLHAIPKFIKILLLRILAITASTRWFMVRTNQIDPGLAHSMHKRLRSLYLSLET